MIKKIIKKILILIVVLSISLISLYFLYVNISSENKLTPLKQKIIIEIKTQFKDNLDKILKRNNYSSLVKDLRIRNEGLKTQNDALSRLNAKINSMSDLIKTKSIPQKLELKFKESLKDIDLHKKQDVLLSNGLTLSKYQIKEGFYYGISNVFPGSGYLDFHNQNLLIISATGILGYAENFEKDLRFKQIKNNINNFISLDQFNKDNWFSIKDLHINDNKILVSYTAEIEENCWTTSIIFSEINYSEINFKKLFSNNTCILAPGGDEINDKEFNGHQSGGKIISLNNTEILFSVGDYRQRHNAQNSKNIFGKIIKINITLENSYEIFSMGHRNPQGLLFDKENSLILSTEHGPQGGDEINLINVNNEKIPNYGWAIASYGEHYGGKNKGANIIKYERYPLLKSHKDNNFIEPLKYFVPSIAIAEIVAVSNKSYITSSMKSIKGVHGGAIYFFDLDSENQIKNFVNVDIKERVRDIVYKDNKLLLYLEDTASIGIINLN